MSAHPFAFFGTPHLAVEILDALRVNGHIPAVIVTMPDRPQGRGMEMKETAVAAWGRERGIEVFKPEKLDSEFLSTLDARRLQLSIVVAYGKILPQALLDTHPMYNIHYSLLPRWRGATPVESAILAGDTETGVAIQRIVQKLDAGPIVAVEKTLIAPDETAPDLRSRLNGIAKNLLVNIFPKLTTLPEIEQDESAATHCGKISKEDGLVSLSDDPQEVHRKFRAYTNWPGIYTFFERGGKQIRTIIVEMRLMSGKLDILTVKPEGKGPVSYQDFLRSGARPM